MTVTLVNSAFRMQRPLSLHARTVPLACTSLPRANRAACNAIWVPKPLPEDRLAVRHAPKVCTEDLLIPAGFHLTSVSLVQVVNIKMHPVKTPASPALVEEKLQQRGRHSVFLVPRDCMEDLLISAGPSSTSVSLVQAGNIKIISAKSPARTAFLGQKLQQRDRHNVFLAELESLVP